MFGVDKIALIRRAHFSDGKKIKEIVRELTVSCKVVRKVVRSGATDFAYIRQVQPRRRGSNQGNTQNEKSLYHQSSIDLRCYLELARFEPRPAAA